MTSKRQTFNRAVPSSIPGPGGHEFFYLFIVLYQSLLISGGWNRWNPVYVYTGFHRFETIGQKYYAVLAKSQHEHLR